LTARLGSFILTKVIDNAWFCAIIVCNKRHQESIT